MLSEVDIANDYLIPVNFNNGATLIGDECTFLVWSPRALQIVVHIYDSKECKLGKFALSHKQGSLWYSTIKGVKYGYMYALEAIGDEKCNDGTCFKKGRFLIDPYAKVLNKPCIFNKDEYLNNNETFIPKAIICDESFDWGGVKKPYFDRKDLILYEAHIKSMTYLNPDVPMHLRGTYLGFVQPCIIEHLKKLGISAVQLMPIYTSMTEPYLMEHNLVNYWGYNPINFFSPDPKYAYDKANVLNEFKTMVKTLHENNIAVILDVVYNHTAEGGYDGPVLSFKGLDARHYYAFGNDQNGHIDYKNYLNFSGCGNTFKADSKAGLKIILDSMKYYLDVMQVDGFRFDLGVSVAREFNDNHQSFEFNKRSAFFKACFYEKSISRAFRIAEPWDLGTIGYRLGGFPTTWSEQNDKFRDTIRRFWRSDEYLTADFATRIMGSRDLFAKGIRSINASVNYVTYHDGFTLEDLVSYNQKHNELNGEDNRDGSNENFSYNYGCEGVSLDPIILAKRRQAKRNMLATVLLSQGIPHLLSGDELCKSQLGNNNAYCQDNDINYLNWSKSKQKDDLISFIGLCSKIRSNSKIIRELNLNDDNFHKIKDEYAALWYKADGSIIADSDWHVMAKGVFLLHIFDCQKPQDGVCLIFNQDDKDVMFKLPILDEDTQWTVLLDTSEEDGIPRRYNSNVALENFVQACSIKVLCTNECIVDNSLANAYEDLEIKHNNLNNKSHKLKNSLHKLFRSK